MSICIKYTILRFVRGYPCFLAFWHWAKKWRNCLFGRAQKVPQTIRVSVQCPFEETTFQKGASHTHKSNESDLFAEKSSWKAHFLLSLLRSLHSWCFHYLELFQMIHSKAINTFKLRAQSFVNCNIWTVVILCIFLLVLNRFS